MIGKDTHSNRQMSKCHADAFSEDYAPNQLISRAHSYPLPYTSERFLITEMTIFVWSMAIFAHRGGQQHGKGGVMSPGQGTTNLEEEAIPFLITDQTNWHHLVMDGPALEHMHQQLQTTTLLNSHCAHLLICREALEDLPDAILNECLHTFTFCECQQFSGATPSLNERFHAVGNYH